MCENNYRELGDYAHDLIRSKARTLIGKAGFTSSDCDDIEQELALDLIARLKCFDPARGKRTTFMTRVVDNRLASLLAERHAACRDWRVCLESFDDPLSAEPDNAGTRIDLFPDPAALTRERLALRIDLQRVVERLPDELRELWERLKGSNLNRVARETGVPRTTLHYRLRRLRHELREAGF